MSRVYLQGAGLFVFVSVKTIKESVPSIHKPSVSASRRFRFRFRFRFRLSPLPLRARRRHFISATASPTKTTITTTSPHPGYDCGADNPCTAENRALVRYVFRAKAGRFYYVDCGPVHTMCWVRSYAHKLAWNDVTVRCD